MIVNIFGGPGSGKSTVASGLHYKLKMAHYSAELTGEYAKDLTYENRQDVLASDQLIVFANQHRRLRRLIDKVDIIISDSPVLLSAVYYDIGIDDGTYDRSLFKLFVEKTFAGYENVNFFLERNEALTYQSEGRNQALEEATSIDTKIKFVLDFFDVKYQTVKVNGESTVNEIMLEIERKIEEGKKNGKDMS